MIETFQGALMLLNRTKKDIALFETHLRMPYMYFNYINKAYPKNLIKVPYDLAGIVKNIHSILRRSMDKTNLHYRYYGIPPMYCGEVVFTAKKEVTDTLNAIIKNTEKFLSTGTLLYLNSPYETSAMIAGSMLCKAVSGLKRPWLMIAYPEIVGISKNFKSEEKYKLTACEDVDFLCLYLIGKEYLTDFTLSGLRSLLAKRKVAGKTTVLTSHLTEKEFVERYGTGFGIVALELSDEAEIVNFKSLRRIVEG